MFYKITILALLLFTPVNSLPGESATETIEPAKLSYGKLFPEHANFEPVPEKIVDGVKTKAISINEEIDLLKIQPVASKKRIQDIDYNFQNQEMVEKLIRQGKASIPFLIEKLDDKSKLTGHIIDFWPDVRVADIAMIMLTNLFTDSSWTKTTIPEAGWDYVIGYNEKSSMSFSDWVTTFTEHHGRKPVKNKWQKTWKKYQNRIYWDEKERCFNIK